MWVMIKTPIGLLEIMDNKVVNYCLARSLLCQSPGDQDVFIFDIIMSDSVSMKVVHRLHYLQVTRVYKLKIENILNVGCFTCVQTAPATASASLGQRYEVTVRCMLVCDTWCSSGRATRAGPRGPGGAPAGGGTTRRTHPPPAQETTLALSSPFMAFAQLKMRIYKMV